MKNFTDFLFNLGTKYMNNKLASCYQEKDYWCLPHRQKGEKA